MSSNDLAAESVASRGEVRMVYIGLMMVIGLGALDQSIVATALPRIVGDLGGITRLSWVVTAYVLTSTATMPLYGKLSDQYGRKPMIYAAVGIFLLGSALSGLAHTMTQLILFRAVQGLGAGGFLPLAQITIGDLVSMRQRGRYQGLFASIFAVSSVAGPVLGGIITDWLSWHWIFYVNIPFGGLAMGMITVALHRPQIRHGRRIDYLGAILLTTATTLLLLALSLGGNAYGWNSPEIIGFAVATVVTAVLFVVRERLAPEPILPLHLFTNKVFVIACAVLSLTFMGMMGAGTFFPVFFQLVLGVAPANSGLLSGPFMLGIVFSSTIGGRMVSRTGRYKPFQIVGVSTALLAYIALTAGAWLGGGILAIEPALIALGLGLGLVTPNMTIAVQNALGRENMGVGTATSAFFRSLGGVIGVAGSGAIMSAQLRTQLALGPNQDVSEALNGGLEQLRALSGGAHDAAVAIYRHALAMTFLADVFVIAAALAVLMFLPELPLRSFRGQPVQGKLAEME
ncbi:MAG TPA: MDR family MFS transporter [Stellaceae bacterium]|nr:MDR family MFS transporter [Stellaceae bacterium]